MTDQDTQNTSEQNPPPLDKSGKDPFILFQEKIELYYTKPLQQYNVARNKAYSAHAKDKGRTHLIAIVCEPGLVPRISALGTYRNMMNPNLAQIVEAGKIYWPPAKQERFVIFYLDNLGKPLLLDAERAALGWRQDELLQIILKPMVNILQDFRDRDFVHGAIRPSNMYDGAPVGKIKRIILGDCLSAPPSMAQPILYEPIERAMADPIARGKGTLADDLYALGVSLAVILRTHDPFFEMSEKEIIQHKVLQGSYIAITGKDRFKGDILELLRGLLHDDPPQRWTLEDLLSWIDGRRLSPKQSPPTKKAARHITFHNDKYLVLPLFAEALPLNPAEAKKLVEDETIPQWIERSVDDETVFNRFEKALSNAKQTGVGLGYEERLVTSLSMALDTMAPLRYKNLALMGDGVGYALVEAVVTKKSLTPFAEIFTYSLAAHWLSFQENPNNDIGSLHTRFEHARRYLRNPKIGEGLERVLYMLCPEAPCLSETTRNYFVQNPDDLLLAYEDLCKKNNPPTTFLDRHVVGFLLQRDSKIIEPYLFDLNSNQRHRVILANIKSLAAIQKRHNVKSIPALTKALGAMAPVVIDRYHDRTVREKMKKNIAEYAQNDELQKIAQLLENQDIFKSDFLAFRKAMMEYSALEKERFKLLEELDDKMTYGIETGKEWSAILSSTMGGFIVLVVAIMFLTNKSFF